MNPSASVVLSHQRNLAGGLIEPPRAEAASAVRVEQHVKTGQQAKRDGTSTRSFGKVRWQLFQSQDEAEVLVGSVDDVDTLENQSDQFQASSYTYDRHWYCCP